MSSILRLPISPGFSARVETPVRVRPVPEAVQPAVEAFWSRAAGFFDKPIVSVVRCSSEGIIGELVPFRAWYAVLMDPSLNETLHIRPLGVTGRVFWEERILVGRRAASSSTYGGACECCPSGSVDSSAVCADGTIDLLGAFRQELAEETQLTCGQCAAQAVYCSPRPAIYDVLIDCRVAAGALPLCTAEYEEFFWVDPRSELPQGSWVPLSRVLVTEAATCWASRLPP